MRYRDYIREMTKQERLRSKEREKANTPEPKRCLSCGHPTYEDKWCSFCLLEE